jgi:hypothetical protein
MIFNQNPHTLSSFSKCLVKLLTTDYKLKIFCCAITFSLYLSTVSSAQPLTFMSSDTALQTAFSRAKNMALRYKGKPGDPVGPWYESALPPRSAFCMRDVSHQSIGAEILGLSAQNKNMMSLFAKNISESKDWCSYWEMNKYGTPAAEDYRSDSAFWYNLNANFDVLTASWKLYLWTGDKTYINSPDFANFHQKSTKEFIDTWVLPADSLLSRPGHPNEKAGYDRKDSFHEYRGLPSYSEGVPHVKMGVDLIAAIYRGLLSYAGMLRTDNKVKEAEAYEQKAATYQQHIESRWWDENAGLYNTHFTDENTFGKGEGETFLLWFDALKDPVRKQKTIQHLLSVDWNIENQSYLPFQFYKNGYAKEAYQYVLHLTNPATQRREYPEVSYGVIEAVVQGLMGVEADARSKTVSTIFRGHDEAISRIGGLPVLGTFISLRHTGHRQSALRNLGPKIITWKAEFAGHHEMLMVRRKLVKAVQETNEDGKVFSYVKIDVASGREVQVGIAK